MDHREKSRPQAALDAQRFHYKRGLGQNFIFDEGLLAALAEDAGVTREDDVLEIGPGSGTLTAQLAQRARRVLAVELDEALLPVLAQTLAPYPNARVLHGDILRTDVAALIAEHLPGRCKVVANLPYYITTEVLTRLLLCAAPIDTIAVMVQREVADKLVAQPGQEGYGFLPALCAWRAQLHRARQVPAACFTPRPKVDSTFLLLRLRETPPVPCADEAALLRVLRCAFFMRRKTMVNNLQNTFSLTRDDAINCVLAAGRGERVRGEALGLEEFARITDALCKLQKK